MEETKNQDGSNTNKIEEDKPEENNNQNFSKEDMSKFISITSKFANLNKLIMRDLNNNTSSPTFSL